MPMPVCINSDFTATDHTASVLTYPSAFASRVLHRLSMASICAEAKIAVACGDNIRAVPAIMPLSDA